MEAFNQGHEYLAKLGVQGTAVFFTFLLRLAYVLASSFTLAWDNDGLGVKSFFKAKIEACI